MDVWGIEDLTPYVYPGGRAALAAAMLRYSYEEVDKTFSFLNDRTQSEMKAVSEYHPSFLAIHAGVSSLPFRLLFLAVLPLIGGGDPSFQLTPEEVTRPIGRAFMREYMKMVDCMEKNLCDRARSLFRRTDFAMAYYFKSLFTLRLFDEIRRGKFELNILREQEPINPDILEEVSWILEMEDFNHVLERVQSARMVLPPGGGDEDPGTAVFRIVWEQLVVEANLKIAKAVQARNRLEIERIVEAEGERLAEVARENVEQGERHDRLEALRVAQAIDDNHRRAAGELAGDGPNR